MKKFKWTQSGKTWTGWHKTELDGRVLLVAYVPHRFQRHKQSKQALNCYV